MIISFQIICPCAGYIFVEGVFSGICGQYDRAAELLKEVLPYAHWGWASVIDTQEGIVVTMCWLQASGLQGDRMQSDSVMAVCRLQVAAGATLVAIGMCMSVLA